MDDLLKSGPNNTREPMCPDKPTLTPENRATMEREINDLSDQLSPKTVEHMMRHPKSQESKAHYDKLDRLLTPHNLKGLLSGLDATSCAKMLAKIETHLKKSRSTMPSTPSLTSRSRPAANMWIRYCSI